MEVGEVWVWVWVWVGGWEEGGGARVRGEGVGWAGHGGL